MHIGFLFNHRIHQVFHSAAVAFELSRRHPSVTTTVVAANEENLALLRRLAADFPGQRAEMVLAYVPAPLRLLHRIARRHFSVEKVAVRGFNRRLFSQMDALVVPESTSLRLRNAPGLGHLAMIRIPHGGGDREVAVNERLRQFDLLLLPGRKLLDRLTERGRLPPDGHYRIVGYPKFDVIRREAPPRLFNNYRPIVLYNPHFDPGLSSWPKMGEAVLEFFLNSGRYNLIFAPHLMLFERSWKFGARLPARFHGWPHILVDTGSLRSSDMTYTGAADVYIGDVSSQVYEFLEKPRPCLFLNAHGVRWRDDPHYSHWRFGPVLDDVAGLETALAEARGTHADYLDIQRQAFAYTFDLNDTPSSARAADAIVGFMEGRGCRAVQEGGVA